MTTETADQPAPSTDLVAAFRAAAPTVQERKFWITLGIAFLAHSLLLLSLVRSAPRDIGDPNAAPEAVAVSFVTEAELMDNATGSDGGPAVPQGQQAQSAPTTPTPATPQQPPTPEQQAARPAPPVEKAPTPPKEKTAAAQPQRPDPKPETQAPEVPTVADAPPDPLAPPTPKEETKRTEAKEKVSKDKDNADTPQELAKEMPDLLALPDATTMQQPPARKQQKQQKQAMRQPDMTLPGQQMTTPSYNGRSAGVERPAGVTRSGANDDFARGVIRALRATMPQMSVIGRVRVRIILNNNGNIASVVMLDGSGNTDLNRAVVFSTKQASFPFPPPGSNDADKTFTITYIYE